MEQENEYNRHSRNLDRPAPRRLAALWLKRGGIDKHAVQQGVLLAVLLAAWFLRIVFME